MAMASPWTPDDDDPVVADMVRCDDHGDPKALALLADFVQGMVDHYNAISNRARREHDAGDLVMAFRGGPVATRMTPEVPIREMLECVQVMERYSGCCYVLAGVYLCRFTRSGAARSVGLAVDWRTAHRLVAVALLLAAKFVHGDVDGGVALQVCVEGIPGKEMAELEVQFLQAIDHRLHVAAWQFKAFCLTLQACSAGASAASGSSGKRKAGGADAGAEEERRVHSRDRPLAACR